MKINLPENVVKLIGSSLSEIEAGLFSKKVLSEKEISKILGKYSKEFTKMYNKVDDQIDNPELLFTFTTYFIENLKQKALLRRNVKKGFLVSSNDPKITIESGIFSKKTLSKEEINKKVDKYSKELTNLYNKFDTKFDNSDILFNFSITLIKKLRQDSISKKANKKSGFFQRMKERGKALDEVQDEAVKIKEKYFNIKGQIMCEICYEAFNNKSSFFAIKYTSTKQTESLRKDLVTLKNKYSDIIDLDIMEEAIEEVLWDGEE